jgi:hypothetical protein
MGWSERYRLGWCSRDRIITARYACVSLLLYRPLYGLLKENRSCSERVINL